MANEKMSAVDDFNNQLANTLEISYADFHQWIEAHPIEGAEETKDFLAYLGFSLYHMLLSRDSSLTLDTLANRIFNPVN